MNQIEIATPEGYRRDVKGNLIALSNIRAEDQLEDQLVAKLLTYAGTLSAQIARFKAHCTDDVTAFLDTIAEKYGAKRGGKKGNMTFMSFDGLSKVTVQVSESIAFGHELQAAKALIDECIVEWAADSNDAIRTLVNQAFEVNQEGKLSVTSILALRRIEISDDRWRQAVQAINDSLRVIGSKTYIRFYQRAHSGARWEAVTIDLASADVPASPVAVTAEAAE